MHRYITSTHWRTQGLFFEAIHPRLWFLHVIITVQRSYSPLILGSLQSIVLFFPLSTISSMHLYGPCRFLFYGYMVLCYFHVSQYTLSDSSLGHLGGCHFVIALPCTIWYLSSPVTALLQHLQLHSSSPRL